MNPDTQLQLRSLVKHSGELELSLARIAIPEPAAAEVLVRIEATPLNPSDLGLLVGAADLATARQSGTPEDPRVTASIPPQAMRAMTARVDRSLPVGNEGAGVVVKAGADPAAQALLGRTVAIVGGGMYSQYRALHATQCFVLPDGITPAQGASSFVNPLTALGMVATMRSEGHSALVHTAAASNLGQMLNRVCLADGVALVNIVRKPEQQALLQALGAAHICNSSSPSFATDLTRSLAATGATIAFDAIGGGRLAGEILTCMEAVASADAKEYSRYGSAVHKQVYVYGNLDRAPTELVRSFGMAWSVGGWLLTSFLQKIGADAVQKLRQRVAAEITTTFVSHYDKVVSLPEALQLEALTAYAKFGTRAKYLINPNRR